MIDNRSAVAQDRSPRSSSRAVVAGALAWLALTLAPAQAAKLEAAFVVLGPQGAIARAILAAATACPAITIDGTRHSMNVRASPDAAFPVLVCELPIPAPSKSAAVEGSALSLPKADLKSLAAFGDT